MANDIANSMSDQEKNMMENMDMEHMVSHLTKNIFNSMNSGSSNGNPMAGIFSMLGGMVNNGGGGGMNFNFNEMGSGSGNKTNSSEESIQEITYPRTRDICYDLNVDLEDFYTGKKKKLNVKRKCITIDANGKQTVVEEKKKLIIPIERGMKHEQQIRFEGEADQYPGYISGDVIITLIENEHPIFERDGDSLIIIKNINLYQAFDFTFDIQHLDGKILRIVKNPSDPLHMNESLRKVVGEGMPVYKKPGTFGDLFVRFNIVLPKCLNTNQLAKLKEIFIGDTFFMENELSSDYNKTAMLENVSETELDELYLGSESEEESEESEESEEESDSISESSEISDSDSISEESESSESSESSSEESVLSEELPKRKFTSKRNKK